MFIPCNATYQELVLIKVSEVFCFNFRGRPLILPEKLILPCSILHFPLDPCINTYIHIQCAPGKIGGMFHKFIHIDLSEQKYIRIGTVTEIMTQEKYSLPGVSTTMPV